MKLRFVFALILGGCAGAGPAEAPRPAGASEDSLGDEHPLNARIYDARLQRFITLDEAKAAARAARFLLLGEKHDNPAHHAGQALLVEARAEVGEPAVVWEMIHREQSFPGPVFTGTPEALAAALSWEKSGWPPFEMYRPVAAAAIDAGLRQYSGNLEPEAMRAAYRAGLEGLGEAPARALGLRRQLEGEALDALREEIARGHCGFGDENMLDSMAAAQQSRDAFMASQMVRHGRESGAILIAGAGHVRRDRAVAFHLIAYEDVEPDDVLVVAWAEVLTGKEAPEDYLRGDPPAFDLVFFTPRISNEDPCDRFAEQVERIRQQERRREQSEDSAPGPRSEGSDS